MAASIARRYYVSGRVQGVGFRRFVESKAMELGIRGYVRNRDDGSVEIYATGAADQLATLEGPLWKGPPWSSVRSVRSEEARVLQYRDFRILS